MINPGGRIVIDVAGVGGFAAKEELTLVEDRHMGGFWAAGDYVGIQRSFVYADELLTVDRYLIVEPDETLQIYNWFQHFTPESIEAELKQSDFKVDQMVGDLTGARLEPAGDHIGVIASLA